MNAECKAGNHKLVEVQRAQHDFTCDAVVRWCEQCGAVSVDIDYDGRTNPGQVMKMIGPKDSGYRGAP